MKKRRFPFLRPVIPRVPKRVFLDWSKKRQNLKFQMGITGAPFGRTELLVPSLEPQERDLARGKGPRVPGGWGVGKQLKNVALLGHFVFVIFLFFPWAFDLFKKQWNKTRNRSNSLGLGSYRFPVNPRIGFQTPCFFLQICWRKRGGKTNFELSKVSRFSGFS